MEEDICRICSGLLDKKSRRKIFSEYFLVSQQLREVLGYVPDPRDGLSAYVCSHCFNKLNKLSKIDFDLMFKLDSLRKDKNEIIKLLRDKMLKVKGRPKTSDSVIQTAPKVTSKMPLTPVKENVQPSIEVLPEQWKRVIYHSPTPRKVKRNKVTVNTDTEKAGSTQVHGPQTVLKKSTRIKLFTPSKIKVTVIISYNIRIMLI
jgi:hypothetical protein